MIDETHVYTGIREKLTKYFPKVNIENADEKRQKRRGFYIDFINSNDEKTAPNILKSVMTFNIVFFAQEDYKGNSELLRVKRKLWYVFLKPLKITVQKKNFYIYLDGITFNLDEHDFTLTMNFDVEISQVIPEQAEILNEFKEKQTIDFENLLDEENCNKEYMQVVTSDINKK